MNPQWIIGPLMGGVIGYITNDIAIRMLFRPREPVMIFGKKLPLTPGLIPKERYRIASAVSDLVSRELLGPDVLAKSLLSDSMLEKIDQSLDAGLAYLEAQSKSPRALIIGEGDGQTLDGQVGQISQTLANLLCDKLLSSGFEAELSSRVIQELRERLVQSAMSPLRLFWDDRLSQTLTDKLSTTLHEMVEKQGPELIGGLVHGALDDGLNTPVNDLYAHVQPYVPTLRAALHAQYKKLVQEQLGRLLAAVDIATVVEQRINALNMAELEDMLMKLMHKELRAIVWLGALLGMVLGVVNSVTAVLF